MSADSWKLTLPCTRAEAEAIDAGAIRREREAGYLIASRLPAFSGHSLLH